jgi:hypothetical protein
MSAWPWLVGAAVAGAGAYLVGWPTWTAIAARRRRDLNAERYLAWRGRAGQRPPDPRLTDRERWRLAIAAGLALVAVFCLVGFFTYG